MLWSAARAWISILLKIGHRPYALHFTFQLHDWIERVRFYEGETGFKSDKLRVVSAVGLSPHWGMEMS